MLSKKNVHDITPFTVIDFPNHLACIVWFVKCNMRCHYCYNPEIVFSQNGNYDLKDVLSFLDKRINLLDGVVLSGGEATLHNLIPFCKLVKQKGFKIKLDTNGTNFQQIKELIESNLIDYIALDYKAPKYKFENITLLRESKFIDFEKTINFLIKKKFNFEVRTTIHSDLLDENDILHIIKDLYKRDYKGTYYLQNYLNTNENIGNITKPSKRINLSKINSNDVKINIEYRNFY